MSWINRIVLLLLATLFLFSGVDKWLHYEGFVNALANYVLVPRGTESFLAFPVIAVELMIGIGLLVQPWRCPAALTAAITLAVFTLALIINQMYGVGESCGCWFTITLARSSSEHIAQNLMLLALALGIWWDSAGQNSATIVCRKNPGSIE